MTASPAPLLCVRNLSVRFRVDGGVLTAVDGIDLDVGRGEILGLVGESGSGKTMTILTLARLVPQPAAEVTADEISLSGRDLLGMTAREMQQLRGKSIGFIFQNPLSSLNPLLSVGEQIAETVSVHLGLSRRAARERAAELLARVGISNPRGRMNDYPHQFSGGMRQRVMIAMAISCEPTLILADEPTTALDVTVQAQIVELLQMIVEDSGTSIILVTHDLGLAASVCARVNVMYAGQIVESADVDVLFRRSVMPYTWGLLDSIPRFDQAAGSDLPAIPGLPPDPMAFGSGCRFADRCAYVQKPCRERVPGFSVRGDRGHRSRCWGTEPSGWLKVGP